MALTYSQLRANIIASTEDDGQEFADQINQFISRAEARLTLDLDDAGLTSHQYSQVVASEPFITLPVGFTVVHSMNITANGTRINLLQRDVDFIADYWPIRASVGTPKYYALWDDTTAIVAPTPVSAFPVELAFVVPPTALTSATPTNYYTSQTPNALFYASMVEAELFNKNFDIVKMWADLYTKDIELLRNRARRARRDDLEPHNQQANNANTINGGP
jgi:hypothetical protein